MTAVENSKSQKKREENECFALLEACEVAAERPVRCDRA